MKKILDISYHSQIRDIKREEWQLHACGVVCVAMVLDFIFAAENFDIDSLIDEVAFVGGYAEGKWNHNALALLARNHGLLAYSQEFRTVAVDVENNICTDSAHREIFKQKGLKKIWQKIDEGLPTIISMQAGFATNISSHIVLVVGYEKNADDIVTDIFVHDPDTREHDKENMKVSAEKFFEYWRSFAIFFEK